MRHSLLLPLVSFALFSQQTDRPENPQLHTRGEGLGGCISSLSQTWLKLFQSDPFQDLKPEILGGKKIYNDFCWRNTPKIKWKIVDRLHIQCKELNVKISLNNKENVVLRSVSVTNAQAGCSCTSVGAHTSHRAVCVQVVSTKRL